MNRRIHMDSLFPPWLIQSKVRPQELLIEPVPRPRLIRKLDSGLDGKLTLLSAPAGYGKTTLMKEWRQHLLERGCAVAWLSLDDGDNAPGILISYLAFALREAGAAHELGDTAGESVDPGIDARTRLGLLSAAIGACQKPVVLMLDGFERLDGGCVKSVVEPALEYFPGNCHIVIGGRSSGNLTLSGLRLGGLATELHSSDLRFTTSEIANCLDGLLDRQQLKQAEQQSEGWPVALQYLRITLSRNSDARTVLINFNGLERQIAAYFLEQVFDGLPEDQREFLLAVSILDEVDIETAGFVTQADNSELLIESMQDLAGFLVALDEGDNRFRLHFLFKDFLREYLRLNFPDRHRGLHRRAAEWLSEQGDFVGGARYALAIGEPETAADIVEAAGGVSLWGLEGMSRLRAAHSLLPKKAIVRRSRLLLVRALVLLKDGRLNDAREILTQVRNTTPADEILQHEIAIVTSTLGTYEGSDPADVIQRLKSTFADSGGLEAIQDSHFLTASCISHLQAGRFDEARGFADKGIAMLREKGRPFGIAYFHLHIGLIDFAEAHLTDALARYRRSRSLMRRNFADDKDMRLVSDILFAEWHFEKNELDTARRLLHGVNKRLVHGEAWYEIYAAGYSTSSALAYELDGLKAAEAETAEALGYVQAQGLKGIRRLLVANRCGYLVRSGKVADARQLVQQSGLSITDYDPSNPLRHHVRERYGVVPALCRLLIAERRYKKAVQELAVFGEQEKTIGYNRAMLKLSLLRAIALHSMRKPRQAFALLGDVLERVRQEGFVRLVLDEAPFVEKLLVAYTRSRNAAEKDHAVYLLQLLTDKSGKDSVVRLTDRERQVLDQLSNGYSDKVIARNLGVSEHTVRYHLKKIFRKLGVGSRLEAVTAAQTGT